MWREGGGGGEGTYDESSALFFVCAGETGHGVEDLDTSVRIDIERIILFRPTKTKIKKQNNQ